MTPNADHSANRSANPSADHSADNSANAPVPRRAPDDLSSLIACEYCDAVYARTTLAPGERAQCLRCGGALYRESRRGYRRLLPLVITALILFVVSNSYPIVEMDLQGVRTQTTLLGAVEALHADGMDLVAALVLATTIVFPLTEMLMMCYLLVPMAQHRMPPGFDRIVRGIRQTRPWGMIEVFMIGVLVTVVKLSTMAQVLPGIALWSFGALVVVLAAMLSFDPRALWDYLEQPTPDDEPAQEVVR